MSKLDYPLTFHPSLPVGEEVNVSEIPIDTGLIQCICESTEDDGFTIQCDRCLTWQHAYCMNINQNNIPDRYLCDNCVKLIPSATASTSAHTLSSSGKDAQRSASKLVNSGSADMELENSNKPSSKKDKYQPTNINTVKSKFVYEVIEETRNRWKQSSKWKSQPWRATASGSATTTQHHSNNKPHYGPFTVMDTISLQQSSSTNIAIRSLPKQQHHQHHHHQRSSYKLRKAAFADTPLHANTFLLEAHGEMVLKSEFKFDAANDYSLLGTSCAHVLFYPTIDLCIDGRRLGNDTRHFRRSCHPNAELRTMIFSQQKKRHHLTTHTNTNDRLDDSLIRLGIFTRAPIEQGEEITLGWNWQKGHISWRKNVEWYRNILHDDTGGDEETDRHTRRAIQQMLERFDAEFGDCACSEHDVCLIERLRQECD
ncbi:hypothetical protein BCR42DRAFT_332868, partial [Absidia repens]